MSNLAILGMTLIAAPISVLIIYAAIRELGPWAAVLITCVLSGVACLFISTL
jgi:hypothetical protein